MPARTRKDTRTIDELIEAYLGELRSGPPKGRKEREAAGQALDLLAGGLNGYGYQYLRGADASRWEEAFQGGAEDAFTRMFGARMVARYVDEFAGYFLIRKVMIGADEMAETIEHIRRFVEWLGAAGALTQAEARTALGRLARASDEVPAAERLSDLLYELAKRNEEAAAASGRSEVFDETVDDYLVVERVAPGRIWFLEGIGPIRVPEAATRLARPGWTINLVLGRRGDTWEVLEVGNVYPEMPA